MSLRNVQVQNSETNHLIVILGMHLTLIIININHRHRCYHLYAGYLQLYT